MNKDLPIPAIVPFTDYQGVKKSGKQLRREKRKKEKRVKVYYKNTK